MSVFVLAPAYKIHVWSMCFTRIQTALTISKGNVLCFVSRKLARPWVCQSLLPVHPWVSTGGVIRPWLWTWITRCYLWSGRCSSSATLVDWRLSLGKWITVSCKSHFVGILCRGYSHSWEHCRFDPVLLPLQTSLPTSLFSTSLARDFFLDNSLSHLVYIYIYLFKIYGKPHSERLLALLTFVMNYLSYKII